MIPSIGDNNPNSPLTKELAFINW